MSLLHALIAQTSRCPWRSSSIPFGSIFKKSYAAQCPRPSHMNTSDQISDRDSILQSIGPRVAQYRHLVAAAPPGIRQVVE